MRVGLIGCGGIAQVHRKSILELGDSAKLIAVCDCEFEKAEHMAEECRCRCYSDWQKMLDEETLDVIHICTPHHLHTQMAVGALERGISVFLEKPPVTDRGQLDILREAVAAAEGKARLAVCFQNRYNESVQYVKKALQSGAFGAVRGARAFVTWKRDAAYYSGSPWRGTLAQEGGGALINQGIHTLDLIQYLIGEVFVSVDAMMDNFHLSGQIEVEDTFASYIRYPDAQALFYVSTAYVADLPPIIELEFERGRLRIEEEEVRIFQSDGKEDAVRFPEKQLFGKRYWGAGHRDAIADFYGAITEQRPCMLDFLQVEESVRLMLSVYEAARKKR